MSIDRRQFLTQTAAACALTACDCLCHAADTAASTAAIQIVDAGPVTAFDKDGIYDKFRFQGFVLIKKDQKLTALSAYCTHKKCRVRAQDGELYCICHGAIFDTNGHALHGPTRKDLPVLETSVNAAGHLLVSVLSRKAAPSA